MGLGPVAPDDLRVRRAEPGDYAAVAATMATPKAYAGTLQLPLPSLEQWRERLAKSDPDQFAILAEVRSTVSGGETWEVVGNLGLHPTSSSGSPRRRHAAEIGMSVRDDWQGRGIGDALMRTALDRADNWMPVLRIELTVYTDNAAAVALYRRHGFVVEGTHRAFALRNGVFVDAYAMARLHPRQPLLPSADPA
jgi:L-phenylalanine/L-methionine N-acetyltransferase